MAKHAETAGTDAGEGRPASREGRRQALRAQILRAAERVFAEAGFAGASMSALAEAAGLPKANLHYYFGTKEALYRAVLDDILALWLSATDDIRPGSDPATALTAYIRAKMRHSRLRPHASRVFANEVLHGAPQLHGFFATELRDLVEQKAKVMEGWIAAGLMHPIDPRHLFFSLWAMTQTYADFAAQITPVLGIPEMDERSCAEGEETILRLILGACLPRRDMPP
ncbi:TetR/AcrR family transcriptional regulator [Roseomonas gilardii subsp. gilardii]|uniref:TetR/AcrR family transcriptional regulator n=1 Tax=Roseomonas gilardii TaxID=257708 RepID=UPI001FFA0826|nr:TetR/AcrR family transcriptional regulator [Roseomonas gilardii]UPG71322.1 TetR/AcrR family transcriptional regulator [Roseomonas gilardii subsp. gilardii]